MFFKSKQRDNSDFTNLTVKNEGVCYCRRPIYERPRLPNPKWDIEMPRVNQPKQLITDKKVMNISGIDPKDIQALKLELAKSNYGTLNGIQVNITEKREKTKIFIDLDNGDYIETISDETIDEINFKLNSSEEFITIGNLNIKRKSVIKVLKTEEQCK